MHTFHAFKNGQVAPGIDVMRTARGHCWETSALESRRYAWRCLEGNAILDPCFSAARHASFVLCPPKPWSTDVVRLRLTRHLPRWRQGADNPSLPVGIWTSNGQRCVHNSGANGYLGGQPITYGCRAGGVLVGSAGRSSRTWKIEYGRNAQARQLERVGVTDAWR